MGQQERKKGEGEEEAGGSCVKESSNTDIVVFPDLELSGMERRSGDGSWSCAVVGAHAARRCPRQREPPVDDDNVP